MPAKQVVKPRRVYEEPEEIETLIPVDELAAWFEAHPPSGEFKPGVFYNRAGDQIEVWFENDLAYAENAGDRLTLERSMDTDLVVGAKVHGVKKLLGLKEILPHAEISTVAGAVWRCPCCHGAGSMCDGSVSIGPDDIKSTPATVCYLCKGKKVVRCSEA